MCLNERQREKLLKKICLTSNELYRRLAKTKDKRLKEAYDSFIKAQSGYDEYLEKNYLESGGRVCA